MNLNDENVCMHGLIDFCLLLEQDSYQEVSLGRLHIHVGKNRKLLRKFFGMSKFHLVSISHSPFSIFPTVSLLNQKLTVSVSFYV